LKIWNWSFVNREGKYDLEKIIKWLLYFYH
jgi:hypothetical protein